MVLVIMQPYLFPYLGYFQLLRAADKFVVYDDVTFIKGGWINRNRWLVQGRPAYFTVPLAGASSTRRIATIEVSPQGRWRTKLLETFKQEYRRAPFHGAAAALLERILTSEETAIGRLAVASLRAVADYLGLATPIVDSSTGYANAHLSGACRVLDVCRQEGATRYVNALGGQDLYDKAAFGAAGIELRFLRPRPITYRQFDGPFVPWLSILDVLAFNPPAVVRGFLREYDLV